MQTDPDGSEQSQRERAAFFGARRWRHGVYFFLIGWLGWALIQLLARTWRWRIAGYEHFRRLEQQQLPVVFAFWHSGILPATFFWRNRGIVVLASQNADGDYSSNIIRRFGYRSIRGSTSRGAIRGAIYLLRALRAGTHVAFTVDGPRGPLYQVQQGVAWMASRSGAPILPFHIEARSAKILASWDRFQIPLPFSEVKIDIAEPMFLTPDHSDEALEARRLELQDTLTRLRTNAEAWAGRCDG